MKNLNYLAGLIPSAVLAEIENVIDKFEINTALRLSHFLAQCAHESGEFHRTTENLNYSAERLRVIFKKYFPNDEMAHTYERHPAAIASLVYANRLGNGDESSADGWTYRGRGYIQLTGKANYKLFDQFVPEDILANPDLVTTQYPLLSAAWFWNSKSLNKIADLGSTDQEVAEITRKVNGGYNGLKERLHYFDEFFGVLNG